MARKKKRGKKKRIQKASPRAETIGFTEIEEAFFASEVQPIDECDEPFPTWRERVRSLFRIDAPQPS